jgi:hypothetical protein
MQGWKWRIGGLGGWGFLEFKAASGQVHEQYGFNF